MPAEQKLQFKPRTTSLDIKPDAPEGEWTALIPKGKCKMSVTQAGDPQLIIPFKLEKAASEENESFQNSEVTLRVVIFDEKDAEKQKASNMMKQRLRALCNALDIDTNEVYPSSVESAEDFRPLFDRLEGKRLTVWTTHNTYERKDTGEQVTSTEIQFREPGSGLKTKSADVDEDDRPGKKNGHAKAAKKSR